MASETSSHSDGAAEHHHYHSSGTMKRYRDEHDEQLEASGPYNTTEPNPAWIKTPLFVTKTYEMLNDCDPNVASWTDDGEMFVVKDQAALAERYIPQFFGHSNFSSFDRQLNFYGFRKSYPDYLRPKSGSQRGSNVHAGKDAPKNVFFHHENFKRGRPDLFHLIKRASSKKPSKKAKKAEQKKRNEVDELKDQVATLEQTLQNVESSLQAKFKFFEQSIGQMKNLVHDAKSMAPHSSNVPSLSHPSAGLPREMSFGTAAANVASNNSNIELSVRRSSLTSPADELSGGTNTGSSSSNLAPPPPLNFKKPEKMTRVTTDEILKDLGPSLLKPASSGLARMTTMDQLMSMDDNSTVALPPTLRQRPSAGFSRKTTDEILNCLNGPNEQDPYEDSDSGGTGNDKDSAKLKVPEKPVSSKLERFSTADVTESLPTGLKPLSGGPGRMSTTEFLTDWMDTSRNASVGVASNSNAASSTKDYADDAPHDATALLMLANQNIPMRRAAS